MTYNVNRVAELLSSEEGQRSYLEWLGNPITQLVLAAARERAKPKTPYPPFTADYRLGESRGGFDVIDYIATPTQGGQETAEPPTLLPTYKGSGDAEE